MKKSEIEQKNLALIEEAIHKIFAGTAWEPIALLGGGLSPAVLYHIAIAGKEYVVRLDDPLSPRNNLTRQYHAMDIASKHAIGPKSFYSDPVKGVAIMQFVKQQLTGIADLAKPEHIAQLSQLLKTLHACEKFESDKSIFETVTMVYQMMPEYLQNNALLLQALELKDKLETLLSDPSDLRPSHCDINPTNILFDGQNLLLIDWHTASMQNFYFDLASCERFFYFYNKGLADSFLKQYFGRELNDTEKNKYNVMSIFVCIYYAIMFLYLSGSQHFPLISNDEINALPSYAEFMSLIGPGKEKLDEPHSQQRFGFVFLKTALADAEKIFALP